MFKTSTQNENYASFQPGISPVADAGVMFTMGGQAVFVAGVAFAECGKRQLDGHRFLG